MEFDISCFKNDYLNKVLSNFKFISKEQMDFFYESLYLSKEPICKVDLEKLRSIYKKAMQEKPIKSQIKDLLLSEISNTTFSKICKDNKNDTFTFLFDKKKTIKTFFICTKHPYSIQFDSKITVAEFISQLEEILRNANKNPNVVKEYFLINEPLAPGSSKAFCNKLERIINKLKKFVF